VSRRDASHRSAPPCARVGRFRATRRHTWVRRLVAPSRCAPKPARHAPRRSVIGPTDLRRARSSGVRIRRAPASSSRWTLREPPRARALAPGRLSDEWTRPARWPPSRQFWPHGGPFDQPHGKDMTRVRALAQARPAPGGGWCLSDGNNALDGGHRAGYGRLGLVRPNPPEGSDHRSTTSAAYK
jgi:hypothetical protein